MEKETLDQSEKLKQFDEGFRIGLERAKKDRRNRARRERDQAMRDIGMVKVRGNLGGTYWE